jgi:hypothetical protein
MKNMNRLRPGERIAAADKVQQLVWKAEAVLDECSRSNVVVPYSLGLKLQALRTTMPGAWEVISTLRPPAPPPFQRARPRRKR